MNAGADLHRQHDLAAPLQSADCLHITLHEIAHFSDTLPLQIVQSAAGAATEVICPAFHIVFDHVRCFGGMRDKLALRCDAASDKAVKELRDRLEVALIRQGIRPKGSKTPHMTLTYRDSRIEEHPIPPLNWAVTRFDLIVSHRGIGHHQRIGEYRLPDPLGLV
ncbi:MAG TPA: 2'-5' RNA ligase family protein [Burkholderiaceae bacterium]